MSVAGGTRRSFLITQAKSGKGEGQDAVWDDGCSPAADVSGHEARNPSI
jgi:hypothetical protein